MSANHTRMSSETYLALVEEIQKLQKGNGEEMRKAEQRVKKQMVEMHRSGQEVLKRMDNLRRNNVQQLNQQIQNVHQAAQRADAQAADVQQHLQQLTQATQHAMGQVATINQQTQQQYATAQQLYQAVTAQFNATALDVNYQRFAGNTLASLQTRMQRINNNQVTGDAMQMLVVSMMNDIYLMDLQVTQERTVFEANYAEAIRQAATILAHIINVQRDAKDQDGQALDINYWTDGRLNLAEQETKNIQRRLDMAPTNPDYSQKQLAADLKRLRELDQIEQQLVAEGIEAHNHSLNREAQALTCMDVLEQDHHFSVVGHGFDSNDRREAYVVRMRRHTDGAEIEVIVNQGAKPGEYDVYFRVDATTYQDEQLMQTITSSIARDFETAGVSMKLFKNCSPEPLEPFNPAQVSVSRNARLRHGIQPQQRPTTI